MPREQFQARLPDVEAQAVHDFADSLDIGKSEATKRLLQNGLDALEDREDPDALLERVSMALAIAGLVSMWGFFAAWSFFDWAVVQPVMVMAVLTAAYLAAGGGVNRYARRRV